MKCTFSAQKEQQQEKTFPAQKEQQQEKTYKIYWQTIQKSYISQTEHYVEYTWTLENSLLLCLETQFKIWWLILVTKIQTGKPENHSHFGWF